MKSILLFLTLAFALVCPVGATLSAPSTPFGGPTLTMPTISPLAALPTLPVLPPLDSPCGVNPYDDYDVPGLTLPSCPPDHYLDGDCVAAALATYNTAVAAAVLSAKIAWNLACRDRTRGFAYADQIIANCAPGNMPQCVINSNAAVVAAQVAFNAATATISTGLSTAITDATTVANAALLQCCVPFPPA